MRGKPLVAPAPGGQVDLVTTATFPWVTIYTRMTKAEALSLSDWLRKVAEGS